MPHQAMLKNASMDDICIAVNVNELWLFLNRRSTPFCPPLNRESETPSPRLRSPRRVLENFRSFAKSFVVSTFTAQKKPVGWQTEIHLVGDSKIMLTRSLFLSKTQVFYHQWFTNRDFSEQRKSGKNSRILWGKTGMAQMPSTGGCKNSFSPQKQCLTALF